MLDILVGVPVVVSALVLFYKVGRFANGSESRTDPVNDALIGFFVLGSGGFLLACLMFAASCVGSCLRGAL